MCHDCLQEPLDESLGALPADETPEADPSDSDGLGWDSRNRNKNTKKFNVFRLLKNVKNIPDGIHSIFNIPQYIPINFLNIPEHVYLEYFGIIGYEWAWMGMVYTIIIYTCFYRPQNVKSADILLETMLYQMNSELPFIFFLWCPALRSL